MNLYQSLGFLVFGSRLKRLSDTFLNDVNRIYKSHNIAFDAAWFPVFYILSQQETVTISDIAAQLEVTHSAASQLVSNLQEKGLVKAGTLAEDARKKVVCFTAKGKKILEQVLPVWTALQKAMEQLVAEGPNSAGMLQAIAEMEASLARQPLLTRIENNL